MRKKTLFALTLAALALTACQNEEGTTGTDSRVALRVTSGIETRAHDNTWEKGDRIGIFGFTQGENPATPYANVPYSTAEGDGKFTPTAATIYLPIDDSKLDFTAYYPYKDLAVGKIYAVDVTDQSDQSAIDLMSAGRQTADRFTPSVAFNFIHKLSKVVFTFKAGSGMSEADLAGMKVKLTGQQTAATFDVTRPDAAVSVTRGDARTLVLKTNATGTLAEGIVLPSDDFNGMTLTLTLGDGDSYFKWDVTGDKPETTGFKAGCKYLYAITVNKTALNVTATITDWTPGNGDGESGAAY